MEDAEASSKMTPHKPIHQESQASIDREGDEWMIFLQRIGWMKLLLDGKPITKFKIWSVTSLAKKKKKQTLKMFPIFKKITNITFQLLA